MTRLPRGIMSSISRQEGRGALGVSFPQRQSFLEETARIFKALKQDAEQMEGAARRLGRRSAARGPAAWPRGRAHTRRWSWERPRGEHTQHTRARVTPRVCHLRVHADRAHVRANTSLCVPSGCAHAHLHVRAHSPLRLGSTIPTQEHPTWWLSRVPGAWETER